MRNQKINRRVIASRTIIAHGCPRCQDLETSCNCICHNADSGFGSDSENCGHMINYSMQGLRCERSPQPSVSRICREERTEECKYKAYYSPCSSPRRTYDISVETDYKALYLKTLEELKAERAKIALMSKNNEESLCLLNEQDNEKLDLLQKVKNLKEQLDKVVKILKEMTEEKKCLEEELSNYRDAESRLDCIRDEYENKLKQLQADYEVKIQDLNDQNQNLLNENLSLKFQLQNNQSQGNNNFDKIIKELNIQIEELKEEIINKDELIDKFNAEKYGLGSSYEEEIQKLKEKIRELQEELEDKNNELEQLKLEMNTKNRSKTYDEKYVNEHLKGENKPTDIRKFIL